MLLGVTLALADMLMKLELGVGVTTGGVNILTANDCVVVVPAGLVTVKLTTPDALGVILYVCPDTTAPTPVNVAVPPAKFGVTEIELPGSIEVEATIPPDVVGAENTFNVTAAFAVTPPLFVTVKF